MSRRHVAPLRRLLSIAVLCCLLAGAGPAGAAKLLPENGPPPVGVQVSGRVYTYYPLTTGETMRVRIDGPAAFDAIARYRLSDATRHVDVVVEVALDREPRWREVFRARPSEAVYPDVPGATPSDPHRIRFDVPSGSHVVSLALVAPSGVLDVNPLSRALDVLPWRVDWRLEAGTSYDSNIFRYGDPDVEGFEDGERPYRYGMDSVDDVRLEPTVEIAFVREEPGERTTDLRFSADWRLALSNGEKSFSRLAARLREERTGAAFLEMGYAAIPKYHVRLLWDTDAEGGEGEYRSCDFRKHAMSVEVGSLRSLPVDVAGEFRLESYAYDPDFIEYDSIARTIGLTATLRPARGLRVDVGYALRSLTARGADEDGEVRSTSDDSDTTYDQDDYRLRLRWEVGRWLGRDAVVYGSLRHSRRFYLTSKPGEADPYHAGREDRYWVAGGRLRLEFTDTSGVEGFYQLRTRAVDSPFVEGIGDLKDYTAHRAGVMFYVERGRFLD